jgi:hypothetical protein
MFLFKSVPFFCTPFVIAIAWWMIWLTWDRPVRSHWRRRAVAVGALGISINALMFYALVVFQMTQGPPPPNSTLFSDVGNVAAPFILTGLVGAIIGAGGGRVLVALGSVMGFLLWVPIAIL